MMINNSPKNFNDLIIPNKDKFLNFYNHCKETNNYNIALVGNHSTCKTTIINIIINNFLKDKKIEPNKIIYKLNYFKDINLQDDNNELHIFCKNNVNSNKIIFIENFDYFNESNQQYLKIYMDLYNPFKDHNKIFFIIETNDENKIKDIIKSRLKLYYLENLKKENITAIFNNLCLLNNITYDNEILEYILNIKNTTISYLISFFIKISLLNVKHIDLIFIKEKYNIINFNLFDSYFYHIEHNNIKDANKILIDLFNDGYDISDIYFYIYEYIKMVHNEKYFILIELICSYINQIYNGNHHKIILILLTNDIKKKLHNINYVESNH